MPPTAVAGPPILDGGAMGRMTGFAVTPARLIAPTVPLLGASLPLMLGMTGGGATRGPSGGLRETPAG
jgi:hypothetical protein